MNKCDELAKENEKLKKQLESKEEHDRNPGMDKLLTTKDLWDETLATIDLEKDYQLLDYSLPSMESSCTSLYDIEFDVRGSVSYGGSEGIYADIYIDGVFGREDDSCKANVGTFKTLSTDDEAFYKMAHLMAEFQIKAAKWVRNNQTRLVRKGYDVAFNGRSQYWCLTLENAKKRAEKHDDAVITDLYAQKIIKN